MLALEAPLLLGHLTKSLFHGWLLDQTGDQAHESSLFPFPPDHPLARGRPSGPGGAYRVMLSMLREWPGSCLDRLNPPRPD